MVSYIGIILFSASNNWKQKLKRVSGIFFVFFLLYGSTFYNEWISYQEMITAHNLADDNYLIQELLKKSKFFGSANLSSFSFDTSMTFEKILPKYYQIDYRIAFWILKYGILPACVILLIVLGMYMILGFSIQKISQKNYRILAYGCFFSLFFQFIVYFIGNFGFQMAWFCNFPIISEGISSMVMNAIFIGIILSLYRNDRILFTQVT